MHTKLDHKIFPKIRSVDIDDLEDWKIAEAFYEKK